MNKQLQVIVEKSQGIIEQRNATRKMFEESIGDEEEKQSRAEADKASAESADEYEDACERLRKSAERLEYYRAALPKYDHMVTREEYTEAKEVRAACAREAAATFRKKTEKIYPAIQAAYREYLAAIKEINSAADVLDEAAGITPGMTSTPIGERAKRYDSDWMKILYLNRPNNSGPGDPARMGIWEVAKAVNGIDTSLYAQFSGTFNDPTKR